MKAPSAQPDHFVHDRLPPPEAWPTLRYDLPELQIADQANLVHALREAKSRGLKIMGVVGRDGGYCKKVGDAVVVVPTADKDRVTPHTEAFQAVVWHCLVSHPDLQQIATKW